MSLLKIGDDSEWATVKDFQARIQLCKTIADLKAIGNELTPKVRAKMEPDDVASLREKYLEREKELMKELTAATYAGQNLQRAFTC